MSTTARCGSPTPLCHNSERLRAIPPSVAGAKIGSLPPHAKKRGDDAPSYMSQSITHLLHTVISKLIIMSQILWTYTDYSQRTHCSYLSNTIKTENNPVRQKQNKKNYNDYKNPVLRVIQNLTNSKIRK